MLAEKPSLTVRDSVPDVQPVILAVSFSHLQGVMLQVKGQELQNDLHLGLGQDGEGAVQVVRVLFWEPRGLNGPVGTGEVFRAIFRACMENRAIGEPWFPLSQLSYGLFKCLGPNPHHSQGFCFLCSGPPEQYTVHSHILTPF